MNILKALISLSILMISVMQGTADAEKIVGALDTWVPWFETVGNNDAKGIVADIFRTAVKRAGHEPEIKIIPTKRRNERAWGKSVDAELACIPEWREKFKDVSVYTVPFAETGNIVLAKKGRLKKTDSVESFYGKTFGANLGYHYTDGFAEAFASGKIKRVNCYEGNSIVSKLADGEVDGIIIDRYEAQYWLKEMKLNPDDFETVYSFKIVTKLRMRFHKDKEYLLEDLNKAIEAMKNDGTIQKIIDSYTK
jgi:ABC-type amino acid transport substrate-binding protein